MPKDGIIQRQEVRRMRQSQFFINESRSLACQKFQRSSDCVATCTILLPTSLFSVSLPDPREDHSLQVATVGGCHEPLTSHQKRGHLCPSDPITDNTWRLKNWCSLAMCVVESSAAPEASAR